MKMAKDVAFVPRIFMKLQAERKMILLGDG